MFILRWLQAEVSSTHIHKLLETNYLQNMSCIYLSNILIQTKQTYKGDSKNKVNTMIMRNLSWLQHMHGTQVTDGTHHTSM